MNPARLQAVSHRAASSGTLRALHEAIKARLEPLVASYCLLSTKTGGNRAPLVFDGWVPPKVTADQQFPFVIVRPRTGTDTPQEAEQRATANIEIIVGTYSDTDDGWLDVLDLIQAIRQDLDEAPTINGAPFEQTGPLTWEVPEEQPRPQWLGRVSTVWTIPRPRRAEALNPVGYDGT